MKRIDITAYGTPQEVASCVEVPDVGTPGPGEVVFDVLAFPINPADISFCRGSYRLRPPLPATPGAECVGRVAAVGDGVTGLRPGDLVVNMQRENWVQRRRISGGDAIPVPSGLDLAQAAMLRINPATALLVLEDHVALSPGDWVIQDVANSAATSSRRTTLTVCTPRAFASTMIWRPTAELATSWITQSPGDSATWSSSSSSAVAGLIRSIAACARSRPDGIGIASSLRMRRRCTQFSRCMLTTRSPRRSPATPGPTAVSIESDEIPAEPD